MSSPTRIVCVETIYPHRHITHVGTGTNSDHATQRWTVAEVRAALRNGQRFYTLDPVTGATADVEPYDAYVGGTVVYAIKSSPDATTRNNLDNLRTCSWRS